MNLIFKVLYFLPLIFSCKSGDKGGDHVPDDKTYIINKLPISAESDGISPLTYHSDYLRRYIHLSESYRICLDPDTFTDNDLKGFESFMKNKGKTTDSSGLQEVLNYALANLESYDNQQKKFSSRIDLNIIWGNDNHCDFLLTEKDESEFPFNHEDFSNLNRILFNRGQLKTEDEQSNRIAIGYIQSSENEDQNIRLQNLLAFYLGLAESHTTGSYINSQTDASTAEKGWFITSDDGKPLTNEETLRIYTYILAYADILNPKDLDTYHYYLDALDPDHNDTDVIDSLLTMPTNMAPISFQDLIGNLYLNGVRQLNTEINICTSNQSNTEISSEWLTSYFSFINHMEEKTLAYHLNQLNSQFVLQAQINSANVCQLMVVFRQDTQFPFKDKKFNGLYTHEGSIKDSQGATTTIPVIYINTSNLEMNPTQTTTDKKSVMLVLRHEFAHFLGMKHSSSIDSILSPAGYNETWKIPGEDEPIFNEYIEYWKSEK
ncbi:MAG: matrixin family metalloprotease [Bdellovibrionota bacterium]